MDKYDSCKECFHNPESDKYIPTLKNFCYSCNGDINGELKTLINNNVNHPSHYNQGNIEVIDYIEEVTRNIDDGFEGGLVFNILKYISRYPYKNGVEDLNKAQWYLNKLIKYKTGKTDKSEIEETKKSEYSFILSDKLAAKIISDEIDINSLNGVFTDDSSKVIVDTYHLPCNNKDDLLKQCKKYLGFVFINEER